LQDADKISRPQAIASEKYDRAVAALSATEKSLRELDAQAAALDGYGQDDHVKRILGEGTAAITLLLYMSHH
jgi:hypothetical protein